ncbi:MAG TPA: metalloregulator ArsR/SmtB family transcription factor, partial [Lacipirellulaceae bacterium]|nr:metalloregulator ArsR/SmtB family transcription factor [Lacipirellulaceae bacterium]
MRTIRHHSQQAVRRTPQQVVRRSARRSAPDALFKSLADPTRRALFERLSRDGEQTVRMLTDSGGVSQPAVSKHLGILKRAGLVRASHSGRETHYTAQPRALAPLVDWMNDYSRFWNDRLDHLEDLLKRM